MIERFKQYYKMDLNRLEGYSKACVYEDMCAVCEVEDNGRVLRATVMAPDRAGTITPLGYKAEVMTFCDSPYNYRTNWYITQYHDRENCAWYNDILCNIGCESIPYHIRTHFRKLLGIKDIEKMKKRLVNYPVAKYVVEGIEKDIKKWDEGVLWQINNDTRTHFDIFTNYLKQGE